MMYDNMKNEVNTDEKMEYIQILLSLLQIPIQ